MPVPTQKLLLRILVPFVIVAPLLGSMIALWTSTVRSFETITTGIAVVGATLLFLGILGLMYLSNGMGLAANPTFWEPKRRKIFYNLALLLCGFLVCGLIIVYLWFWSLWKLNVEATTVLGIAGGLIVEGLMLILELFMFLNLFQQRRMRTDGPPH